MSYITTSELRDMLEAADPTGLLPVTIAREDGPDVPISSVLPTTASIVLWPLADELDMIDTIKFAIGAEDSQFWVDYYTVNLPNGIRVGPSTYDMLVVESVIRELYERINEFQHAVQNNQQQEFVAELYDLFGGA